MTELPRWRAGSWAAVCQRRSTLCRPPARALWSCRSCAPLPVGCTLPHLSQWCLDPPSPVVAGLLRLAGGSSSCSGRLEVLREGTWGHVCANDTSPAAQVVCRELGCGTAVAVPAAGHFGAATGPLWDGAFECNGSEPLLASCARRPTHGQACAGPAAIVCSRKCWGRCPGGRGSPLQRGVPRGGPALPSPQRPLCAPGYTGFRLADGGSGCAGRVEVEATGPLRRDALSCSGSERHPGECPVALLGEPACPPGHAAAVNCSGGCRGRGDLSQAGSSARPHGTAGLLQAPLSPCSCWTGRAGATGGWRWPRAPGPGPAWLRGRGMTELPRWRAGSWAAVCQRRSTLCRPPARALWSCRSCAVLAARSSWRSATPRGLPQRPATAPQRWPLPAQVSAPGRVAGAQRLPPAPSWPSRAGSRRLRLAGGPGRCAGRVEVYSEGMWGTVCQDAWDLPDADVVCRQLGCGRALEAPGSERFGPGVGTLWPGAGGCSGTEAALWACPAPARRGCRRGGGAGAVCSGR
uniref:SRCR domain-containing protein n=1 Tax=Anas platyrhynchos TaxID=8839 RepID=A0A8B9QQC3_ANAPL